jgi:hypothetical protein
VGWVGNKKKKKNLNKLDSYGKSYKDRDILMQNQVDEHGIHRKVTSKEK